MTNRIGLMSYTDYSKIANCSTFSCGSSYLNIGSNWGLGTYYRIGVLYGTGYDISNGNWNRIVYPHYNTTLYVLGNGNVGEAMGSMSLLTTTGSTKATKTGDVLGVRPVIVLNATTKITGGPGTASDQFRVG